MNKEQLIAAGFSEAQVTEILKLHKQAIDGQFVPKHRFDEVNNELKTTKEQLGERDKQIEGLKKFEGDSKALTDKIKELEDANKQKDNEHKTVLLNERKRNAVKVQLLEDEQGKPYDTDMVMGLFDLEKITFDEATGKITAGYKEQSDTIRTNKGFLFETKSNNPNNQQGWKPKGNNPKDGDGTPPTNTSEMYGSSLAAIKLGMMGIDTKSGNAQ